jgi:hypothetical protein
MKPLTTTAKMLLPAVFALLTLGAPAQANTDKEQTHKYSLHIVKEDNGKQEIIDRTFSSKAEMDAYVKENNFDAPQAAELPPLPETPAAPPAPSTKNIVIIEKHGIEKPCEKHGNKSCEKDKKTKKVIIIEKDESSIDGKTDLQITYTNLSAEERAQKIQEMLNKHGEDVQIMRVKKEIQKDNGRNEMQPGPVGHIEPGIQEVGGGSSQNISDVKIYPNPANGEFHVAFNIEQPANVKLRITDMAGKEVYAEAWNNYSGKIDKDITGSNLSRGTYLMYVQAGAEKSTTQVVMQ